MADTPQAAADYFDLLAHQAKMPREPLKAALSSPGAGIEFNQNNAGLNNLNKVEVNVNGLVGKTVDLDTVGKTNINLVTAMSLAGAAALDQAEAMHVDITKVKGFENADFRHDGKVTPDEVGALLLAASAAQLKTLPNGDHAMVFDNDLSFRDIAKLTANNPDVLAAARAIVSSIDANDVRPLPDGTQPDVVTARNMKIASAQPQGKPGAMR